MDEKVRIKELEIELGKLQREFTRLGIPMLISIDGLFGAGKGGVINKLGLVFDPRGVRLFSTLKENKEDKMYPFLYRFWKNIPSKGRIRIFERSWNYALLKKIVNQKIDEIKKEEYLKEINNFERTLTDSGVLLIKIFLNVSKEEQKSRVEKMMAGTNTRWDVVKSEKKEYKNYELYKTLIDDIINKTNNGKNLWKIVDSDNLDGCILEVLEYIKEKMEKKLKDKSIIKSGYKKYSGKDYIAESKINEELNEEIYNKKLKQLQKELMELEYKIYKKRVPVIIAYEGSDAAGKGGNIRRVVERLDPRGYEVVPIAAPNEEEKSYHYLWRFWRKIPKAGHLTIFDRTWYGRVLVERVEGFATEKQYKIAYNEINEMEKVLTDYGAVVIKIWLQIDKEEQLKRFEDRQNTPEKQWKITDEDWRNREKWDKYQLAVNEMVEKTNTDFAKWKIINTNNKMTARIEALKFIIDSIKKVL